MARVSDLFKDIRELVEKYPLDVDLIKVEIQSRYKVKAYIAERIVSYINEEIRDDEDRDTWLDNQQAIQY